MQVLEIPNQVLLVLSRGAPIDSRAHILSQPSVCLAERLDGEQVR
jgi:hypothetical protein